MKGILEYMTKLRDSVDVVESMLRDSSE